jgi:succinate dehydrogenase / fumarate reductase cytochrome b subunit
MGTVVGQVILFGYTWALIHHMFGGVRHFIWDTGHGYGPTERELLVIVGLAGSIVTTIVLWVIGYAVMGNPR